jgi:hypothetical protein
MDLLKFLSQRCGTNRFISVTHLPEKVPTQTQKKRMQGLWRTNSTLIFGNVWYFLPQWFFDGNTKEMPSVLRVRLGKRVRLLNTVSAGLNKRAVPVQ